MTLADVQALPGIETIHLPDTPAKISGGFTSDLLSDVMGHAQEGDILVTIQAHKNTVAVATLAGIPAILICSSRPIPEDMISAVRDENIALFRTAQNQFNTSAILHRLLCG